MGEFMRDFLQLAGLVALWIGVAFCMLSVLGLFRLPDVYTRLHASGKVSTLGLAGVLLGAALIMPSSLLKAAALAIFIIITSPVATHVIALAAYRSGVPIAHAEGATVRDDTNSRNTLNG